MRNGNDVIATYPVITGKIVKLGNISKCISVYLRQLRLMEYLQVYSDFPNFCGQNTRCLISDKTRV